MPAWQVIVLLLAAVAVFYLVLSVTNPRARASQAVVGHARPKCYPMADDHAVRMLGPENKAYRRTIATSSPGAQVLFNLGMLAAHGFNQVEATSWLQVSCVCCLKLTPCGSYTSYALLGVSPSHVSQGPSKMIQVLQAGLKQAFLEHRLCSGCLAPSPACTNTEF